MGRRAREVGFEVQLGKGNAADHARIRCHIVDARLQVALRGGRQVVLVVEALAPVVEQEILRTGCHEAGNHGVDFAKGDGAAHAITLTRGNVLVELVVYQQVDAAAGKPASGFALGAHANRGGAEPADCRNVLDRALHLFNTGGHGFSQPGLGRCPPAGRLAALGWRYGSILLGQGCAAACR